MQKISVVIPTLQKNKSFFYNLLNSLEHDDSVDEIIVIDNSLEGLNSDNDYKKIKLIIPNENIFVNPSWNCGVKEAKNEIIALINDDIIIPDDFCKSVSKMIKSDMGVIGFNNDYVTLTEELLQAPVKSNTIELKETNIRNENWGIAIFFYKSAYIEIPDELKIYYGDDWIFNYNKKQNRKNYCITGQNIYHYGSLSSSMKGLNSVCKNDKKMYKKLTMKFYHYIFSIEKLYNGFRIYFLGFEITHKRKNKNKKSACEKKMSVIH